MPALSDARDILKGVVGSMFGFGGRLVARALLMILAGRVFGLTALGELGQLAALSEMTAAVCVMGTKRGLHDMMSHEVEAGREPYNVLVNIMALTLCLSVLAAVCIAMAWWIIFPTKHYLVGLLCLAVPAIVLTDVALTATKFRRVVRWDVLSRGFAEPWMFLFAALLFASMGLLNDGLLIAYILSVLASLTVAIFGFFRLYRRGAIAFRRIDPAKWPELLKKSLPLGLTDIGVMGQRRIDLIVLGIVAGPQAAGLYYMAQQVVTVPHKIGALFEPMLSPVLAGLHNRGHVSGIQSNLVAVCRWVFILQLAITIPIIVFGADVLTLFGPEFSAGVLILALLAVSELIDGTFLSAETPLLYAYPKIPPTIIFIALAVEVVAIWLLSSLWGAEGAALGYGLAVLTLTTGRLIALRTRMGIRVLTVGYMIPLSAGLAFAALLLTVERGANLPSWMPLMMIAIGLLSYAWIIRRYVMSRSDRVMLRALRRRRTRLVA